MRKHKRKQNHLDIEEINPFLDNKDIIEEDKFEEKQSNEQKSTG